MRNILSIIFAALLLSNLLIAQTDIIEFKSIKPLGDSKVVYFKVANLINDDTQESLKHTFETDINIKEFYIYTDGNCKLVINNIIDGNYIKNLLLSQGLDYDYSTVKIIYNQNSPVYKEQKRNMQKNRTDRMPEHYPIFVDTGNSTLDNENYDKEKQQWYKEYPEEVAKLTGREVDEFTSNKAKTENYPIYINTGNPKQDKENFEKDKTKWAEKNSNNKSE